MSRTAKPKLRIPKHTRNADAVRLVMGSRFTTQLNAISASSKSMKEIIDVMIYGRLGEQCQKSLEAMDEYLDASLDAWDRTSYMTGNTRGSIKVVGKYPRTISVEFDKDYWETPKVLTIIRPINVKRVWVSKRDNVERSRWYSYAAGKYKRRITGADYAPRIPAPDHGGGNIDMLIEVYEEMKKDAFNKARKRKGI